MARHELAIKERGLFIREPDDPEFVAKVRRELSFRQEGVSAIRTYQSGRQPGVWTKNALQRRVFVMSWLLCGFSRREIGKGLNIPDSTLDLDIAALKKMFNARSLHHLTAKVIVTVDK